MSLNSFSFSTLLFGIFYEIWTVGHFGWRHQYNNRNNTMQIVTKAFESSMFSDFISGRSSNSSPVWLSLWIYTLNVKMNGPLCDCVNHNNHTPKKYLFQKEQFFYSYVFCCCWYITISTKVQCKLPHKYVGSFYNYNVKIENIPNLKRFLCISIHALIEEKPANSFRNETVSLD